MAEIADRRPLLRGPATGTATTTWNPSNWRADAPTTRTISDLEVSRRLKDLPRRAEQLLLGLDNSENDPELVFRDLPYRHVMAAAAKDPHVAAVLRRYGGAARWLR